MTERLFCPKCGPDQKEFHRPCTIYSYDTVDEKGEEIEEGEALDYNFDGDITCVVCNAVCHFRTPNNIELMKGAIEDAGND